MGLLSDVNWRGAFEGAGKAVAQYGQLGAATEFDAMRQERLAQYNAGIRATERGEEREYQKGLLEDQRSYEAEQWQTRNTTEHEQAMTRAEKAAKLKDPTKLDYYDMGEDGTLQLNSAIYQGGELIGTKTADASKVNASKKSTTDKTTTIKEFRDDIRSNLTAALKQEGDFDSWDSDAQQRFLKARDSAEEMMFAGLKAGVSLDAMNQGEIVRLSVDVADGNMTLEEAITGKPVAEKLPEAPTTAERERAAAELNTEKGGGFFGQARGSDFVPFNEVSPKDDAATARAYQARQGGQQQPAPAKPAAQGAGMASPPPAAQHVGKVIVDRETGQRYRSDGTNWVKVQ